MSYNQQQQYGQGVGSSGLSSGLSSSAAGSNVQTTSSSAQQGMNVTGYVTQSKETMTIPAIQVEKVTPHVHLQAQGMQAQQTHQPIIAEAVTAPTEVRSAGDVGSSVIASSTGSECLRTSDTASSGLGMGGGMGAPGFQQQQYSSSQQYGVQQGGLQQGGIQQGGLGGGLQRQGAVGSGLDSGLGGGSGIGMSSSSSGYSGSSSGLPGQLPGQQQQRRY